MTEQERLAGALEYASAGAGAAGGGEGRSGALELVRLATDPRAFRFLSGLLPGPRRLAELGITGTGFAPLVRLLRHVHVVEANRSGRHIAYALTPLGEALVRGVGAAADAALDAAAKAGKEGRP